MKALQEHILSFVDMPQEVFDLGKVYFKTRKVAKGDFICQAGDVCSEVAFIKSGVMRSFYKLKGKEVTRFVLMKNNFITALASFISRKPTTENLQAIKDCELYVISNEDIQALYGKYLKWQELGRLVVEKSHLQLERRVFELVSMTAAERYESITQDQPDMVDNVPLQYIASIIGVKPETLSRIRKKVGVSANQLS